MKINIRLYKGKKLVKRMTADRTKWRKVYAKLASAHATTYFVDVVYGRENGTTFRNTYDGNNLEEAKQAFKAFIEK